MTDSLDTFIKDKELDTVALLEIFFEKSPYLMQDDKQKIKKAWDYLLLHTKGIKRSCNKPYYLHPLRVAFVLSQNKMDSDCIVCGIFHNILEIQGVDTNEIRALFGDVVLKIISQTAKITSLKIKNKTLQQADSIRKMLFAMIDDIRVILVKLADRLDRMRNLKSISLESQRAVAHEVIDIWAPLASRLGMGDVKNELEDLSLKYTNPSVFLQIKEIVALKKEQRMQYLLDTENKIKQAAHKAGIEITVTSRAKHFYSIYQKMRKRGKEAAQLYDLLAMRIICNTVGECYTLIGLVHGLWKPLDGRFKDYIAMPKANGYQSLHTTVLCSGFPLEIQIRTQQMHQVAEHGVASHWLYKKGTNHDLVNIQDLSIVNQLKALKAQNLNDEALFAQIKDDILGDEIFVFTPKGDVVELPAGSTAVDFAYHIHSDIGQKIVAAKADGKIIPLSEPLKNTQIIDILTNQKAHPTVNQLNSVHTSKAKAKIKAWLIANDTTFVERPPLPNEAQKRPTKQKLPPASNVTAPNENSNNGNAGNNSDNEGIYKNTNSTQDGNIDNTKQKLHSTGKIKIEGKTNFLVSLANCCKPCYPDPIVGYVSRGRGVIIHRADCTTFYRIPNIQVRTLEVEWEEK